MLLPSSSSRIIGGIVAIIGGKYGRTILSGAITIVFALSSKNCLGLKFGSTIVASGVGNVAIHVPLVPDT